MVSSPDEEPKVWQELLVFNRFNSEYDDEDYLPQLTDEWLTEGEIREKKATKDSVNQNNYGTKLNRSESNEKQREDIPIDIQQQRY